MAREVGYVRAWIGDVVKYVHISEQRPGLKYMLIRLRTVYRRERDIAGIFHHRKGSHHDLVRFARQSDGVRRFTDARWPHDCRDLPSRHVREILSKMQRLPRVKLTSRIRLNSPQTAP